MKFHKLRIQFLYFKRINSYIKLKGIIKAIIIQEIKTLENQISIISIFI